MNSLVASVIRTYTPIIVGQLAAWLIMIHVPVRPELDVLLTALVGAALSAAYYTLVRILEQQWPWFGALLGLTASPDTYSKGSASPETAAVPANPALGAVIPAVVSFTPAETVTVDTPAAAAPVVEPAPAASDPAPAPVPVPTV